MTPDERDQPPVVIRQRYGDGIHLPGATFTAAAVDKPVADKARLTVASAALDVDDCVMLLDMLGLHMRKRA